MLRRRVKFLEQQMMMMQFGLLGSGADVNEYLQNLRQGNETGKDNRAESGDMARNDKRGTKGERQDRKPAGVKKAAGNTRMGGDPTNEKQAGDTDSERAKKHERGYKSGVAPETTELGLHSKRTEAGQELNELAEKTQIERVLAILTAAWGHELTENAAIKEEAMLRRRGAMTVEGTEEDSTGMQGVTEEGAKNDTGEFGGMTDRSENGAEERQVDKGDDETEGTEVRITRGMKRTKKRMKHGGGPSSAGGKRIVTLNGSNLAKDWQKHADHREAEQDDHVADGPGTGRTQEHQINEEKLESVVEEVGVTGLTGVLVEPGGAQEYIEWILGRLREAAQRNPWDEVESMKEEAGGITITAEMASYFVSRSEVIGVEAAEEDVRQLIWQGILAAGGENASGRDDEEASAAREEADETKMERALAMRTLTATSMRIELGAKAAERKDTNVKSQENAEHAEKHELVTTPGEAEASDEKTAGPARKKLSGAQKRRRKRERELGLQAGGEGDARAD